MTDDYLDKSPDAARMGKAAEYLVAASAILATRGQLNVSTSLVDDDGVDLVFHRRGHTATLAVQVKSRMADGVLVQSGRVQANVREATFRPRRDLDMLFVVVDPVEGRIVTAWLVPSGEFARLVPTPNGKGRRVFSASAKPDTADRWRGFRLTPADLAGRLLDRLAQLDRLRA
ncbi:hypothetical protein [Pseudonocardia alni]|uniref:DUF4365 domain-containing protein n=1 Tax=Pseudonocardia alni TaxID=33907 RepID=A0A852W1R7_PSEA5|nr:hypothetical protein [Pseudonocardia antarctica]NYG00355.1 hypothetical protein [Pseudonocardia antarctica]